MKKAITLFAILALVTGLCAGCEKDADKLNPETTQQSQENSTTDWEPETATEPADHDHSHDGHDHGDHSGHDH